MSDRDRRAETSAEYVALVLEEAIRYFASLARLVSFGGHAHTAEVSDADNRRVLLIAVPVPEPDAGAFTTGELIAHLATAPNLDAPVVMSMRGCEPCHIDTIEMPGDEGIAVPTLSGGADFEGST